MPFLYERQTLYTGSNQFISGVSIWLQAKGGKPKSKPKVGCIWNAWIWFLQLWLMNGSMEKHKLNIPFCHHSISWNAITWLYICIFIQKSHRFSLFEHYGWFATQRLCIYKLLRGHTASRSPDSIICTHCSAVMPQSNLQFHQPHAYVECLHIWFA